MEDQERAYLNSNEALSCFRQLKKVEKEIDKRNIKMYPMFSGEKMMKRKVGLVEDFENRNN